MSDVPYAEPSLVGILIDEDQEVFCLRVGETEAEEYLPIMDSAGEVSCVEYEGRSYQATCYTDQTGQYQVCVTCDGEPVPPEEVDIELILLGEDEDEDVDGEEDTDGEEEEEEEEEDQDEDESDKENV
jgi:hypothetical protein